MHRYLEKFIDKVTRPSLYLLLLIAFVVLFIWMEVPAIPYSTADFAAHMNGVPSLDMMIGYSPDKAYEMLCDYGAEGRGYYASKLVINDMVFPAVYSLFFAATLALLLKCWTGRDSRLGYLAFLPLAGGVCDILENGGILSMLLSYPARLDWIAMATALITIVKLTVNVTVLLFIVIGFAMALYHKLRNSARGTASGK